MIEQDKAPAKGAHDPADCNDRAQLAALFKQAQSPKPLPPPVQEIAPDPDPEETLRLMRLNFWDI